MGGAAGAQWQSESSPNRKVGGSIPGSAGLHVEVSLGKTLNPTLPPMVAPSVCECVCERVNVCSVKSALSGLKWLEKRYISAVHLHLHLINLGRVSLCINEHSWHLLLLLYD